jgi:anti-sigma regulatory factor (Ser/Thr protein kinase)
MRSNTARARTRRSEFAARSLTIEVADAGSGFDPEEVKDKIEASRRAGTNTRGWGLTLIKELMDEVVFDSDSQGTRITMHKNRLSANLG